MMRAWTIEQIGIKAVQKDIAQPKPGQGEALIKIAACGLNFADLLMQDGSYQERPALPFIPGMEIAGTVVALGPNTDGPAPGTRVERAVGVLLGQLLGRGFVRVVARVGMTTPDRAGALSP